MIGDTICKLRTDAGYTQKELADKLNITPSAIGMYEQNRRLPNIESLILLTKIFNVSADYLLGLSDDKKPSINTSYDSAVHEDSVYDLNDEYKAEILSEDEEELIDYFRKLNKLDKHVIMGNIASLMKQTDY